MKKDYEAPAVAVLGSVAELTLLNTTGGCPDVQLQAPSAVICQ
jgi:hypothetical protein